MKLGIGAYVPPSADPFPKERGKGRQAGTRSLDRPERAPIRIPHDEVLDRELGAVVSRTARKTRAASSSNLCASEAAREGGLGGAWSGSALARPNDPL